MLNGLFGGGVRVFSAERRPDADGFDPSIRKCCCSTPRLAASACGARTRESAYPFVFRRRLVKSTIPCAQLIYCRDIADFVRFAGPIGRLLARRGRPLVIIDANGPIAGVVGWYSRGNMPKYFKGPQRPASATSPTPNMQWGV